MQRTCRTCQQGFEVADGDLEFLVKLAPTFNGKAEAIPPPTQCLKCRQRRRLAFRNERKLYNDQCDSCGKDMVSLYSPQPPSGPGRDFDGQASRPQKVYCQTCWYSDKYDPLAYGRPYDFSRTFTEQMAELALEIPVLSSIVIQSTNCDYSNYCVTSKDCYLSCRLGDSEGILYSYLGIASLRCMDCYGVFECQLCYECVDCEHCYGSQFLRQCKNVTDSQYSFDCVGCRSVLGCAGLRNKEYHVFNEPVSKEEYEKVAQTLRLSRPVREAFHKKFGFTNQDRLSRVGMLLLPLSSPCNVPSAMPIALSGTVS